MINVSEIEKNRIRNLYDSPIVINNSYTFENHITIDGRFYIFEDEVFDFKNGEYLGNVFSLKNIKKIFNEVVVEQHDVLFEEISNFLKFAEKNIINESLIRDEITDYVINQRDIISEQKIKNPSTIGTKIGEWFLKITRWIKKKLWTIGGMALDAALAVTQIGKVVQWIPWALVLALDVYQITSGNYGTDIEFKESSPLMKAITIGCEILGMMTTGVVAKSALKVFKPISKIKNTEQIAKWISINKPAQGILSRIHGLLSSVGSKFNEAIVWFSQKFPKLSKFLSGLTNSLSKILNWIGELFKIPGKIGEKIGTVIGGQTMGQAGKAAASTAAFAGGIIGGMNLIKSSPEYSTIMTGTADYSAYD